MFSGKFILCGRLDLAQERSFIHEDMTFKISKTRRRKGRRRKGRRRKDKKEEEEEKKGEV